jgi:DNA-binding winged helix-turn-helix (wHTH) protein
MRIVTLIFRFKDFEIDVARQELRRTGTIVHIEPQVFDLLVHLIQNRDRIVSRDELIDAVWQGRIVSDATLSSRISSARRALGDSGNDQNLIRTLHRRGFRFVGDVEGRQLRSGCHCDREWGCPASRPRCREARAGGRTAAARRRSFD